jgi:hypothetical protein
VPPVRVGEERIAVGVEALHDGARGCVASLNSAGSRSHLARPALRWKPRPPANERP